MSLSDRLRPDCEAAPWVIEEVKKLELENSRLREVLYQIAYGTRIGLENWSVEIARDALEGKK